MIDPRTPVIVGVGQAEQRPDDPADALEPVDLLAVAARAADADSGARRSPLAAVDTVAVVQIVSWRYPDPGALLARRLALPGVRSTVVSTVGGNSPQLLVTTMADEIARGERSAVLLGGSESLGSRLKARKEPRVHLPWSTPEDPPCPLVVGDDRPGNSEYEQAHHADAPIHVYPLLETALRAARGRSVEEHQVAVSELWGTFAAVAAANPHAWTRVAYTPEEIRTAGPGNRVVTFPYTLRMVANQNVDQAAALLLCSYEAARAAGVPDDRMVFPLACADAHDRFSFSERLHLHESPAIRAAGTAALRAAGFTVDDVARFDLYSCFPSAVEIAMDALGLAGPGGGDDRPLTVTGGLAFAGGPVNDYATHAIAAMVDACRHDPGSVGFVSALGWYVTKHSIGLYSATPPAGGFVRVEPAATQAEVDALPGRETAELYDGDATVEATEVLCDRDGVPTLAVVCALTPDGRRVLANTSDADALDSMMREVWEGRSQLVRNNGVTHAL